MRENEIKNLNFTSNFVREGSEQESGVKKFLNFISLVKKLQLLEQQEWMLVRINSKYNDDLTEVEQMASGSHFWHSHTKNSPTPQHTEQASISKFASYFLVTYTPPSLARSFLVFISFQTWLP